MESSWFTKDGYRGDIDGLRAFAVSMVLLFHAWPNLFPFGFIGVDIFFVISGYLITGIIIKEGFTFRSFYQRRVIRIVPPLLMVLIAALLIGWLFLTPEEYAIFGAHLRSSSFFGANFHLLGEAGYFDIASAQKPLLHLWSLAIEEQFYILYPLILIIAAKYFKPLFTILIIIGLSLLYVSFLEAGTLKFYSPLARAFELGLGGAARLIKKGEKYNTLFTIIGIILLGLALIFSKNHNSWPNPITIMLCVGVALILWGGSKNGLFRAVIANRVMVFVGLISYELYLWHWIFLSFGFIITGGDLSNLAKILLLLLSFAISALCFFIFEKPIRINFGNNLKMGALLLGALCAIGIFGQLVVRYSGFPHRIGEAYIDTRPYLERGAKFFPDWKKWTDANQILLQDDPDKIDMAIVGDSHAGQLANGFFEELSGKKKLGIFPASGQAPWPGIATLTQGLTNYRANGYKLIEQAYEAIAKNPNIKTVILAHNPDCSYDDILDPRNLSIKDRDRLMTDAVRNGLEQLQKAGKNVIIVLDNPHTPFGSGSAMRERPLKIFSPAHNGNYPYNKDEKMRWYERICREAAKNYPNVRLVDLYDSFCAGDQCSVKIDGKSMYNDSNHLNSVGSRVAARYIINSVPEFFK